MQSAWTELTKCKCKNHQCLKLTSNPSYRLSQFAFDPEGEALIVADSTGQIYIVDLVRPDFSYRKLGYVGQCNFVQFDPRKTEFILIGLNTNEIKVASIDDVSYYCILSGHTSVAKRATFYQEFCMTVSSNEAIIWCLETYSKVHHLKLISDDLSIKNAAFSNKGLIGILFKSNIVQCWLFRQFDETTKVNLNNFDLRNVKDIDFSRDGKMMIVGGNGSIIIFDAQSMKVMKRVNYNLSGASISKLVMIDRPFNYILAALLSNCNIEFFNLSTSSLMKYCQCREMKMAKRMDVSKNGKYLAHVRTNGVLVISFLDKILSDKIDVTKNKEFRVPTHSAEDHLHFVQMAIREELRLERLLPILKEFGEYPKRHRVLIWSSIMNLPTNQETFLSLMKNATESFNEDTCKNYSLADKSKATLLQSIVKCLICWCPLLGQNDFIPELVFPFIVVFQKNPILAFETSLVIILNFCQKWFEYHPLPPINILGIIENILLESDPRLLEFFCERGITSTDYAWPLLRTTFSIVLPANEWLILWDHLLSYGKPSLLLCCVVAFNLCSREVIITSMKTPEDVQRFYNSQGHIPAKKLLKIAQNLDKLMPARIHPNQYIRNTLIPISVGDVYTPLSQLEYPKILANDFNTENMKKLREQEKIEQKRNREVAKIAERRRMELESENFRKQIEKARMEELRKCYEKLNRRDLCFDNDEDVMWHSSENSKVSYQTEIAASKERCFNNKTVYPKKSEFCKSMQKEVEQLERDMCNLFGQVKRIN